MGTKRNVKSPKDRVKHRDFPIGKKVNRDYKKGLNDYAVALDNEIVLLTKDVNEKGAAEQGFMAQKDHNIYPTDIFVNKITEKEANEILTTGSNYDHPKFSPRMFERSDYENGAYFLSDVLGASVSITNYDSKKKEWHVKAVKKVGKEEVTFTVKAKTKARAMKYAREFMQTGSLGGYDQPEVEETVKSLD